MQLAQVLFLLQGWEARGRTSARTERDASHAPVLHAERAAPPSDASSAAPFSPPKLAMHGLIGGNAGFEKYQRALRVRRCALSSETFLFLT